MQSSSLAEFARSGSRTFAERATQADRQEPNGPTVSPGEGPVRFTLDEMAVIVGDLMRTADDLKSSSNEVNAYLLDLVVNRLLDRAFGGGRAS